MIGKRKTWKQATEDAIVRFCRRRRTTTFDFNSLVTQELPQILEEVQSRGATPEQSLSKFLQDLRNEGKIEFVDNRGTYELLDPELRRLARLSD